MARRSTLSPLIGAIVFTIPPAAVAAFRAWRPATDLAYIRARLADQGWAWVYPPGDRMGLQRITTLPALGAVEAHCGTFGGCYRFVFRPRRAGCALTIEAPTCIAWSQPLPPAEDLRPVAPPLELAADPPVISAAAIPTLKNNGIIEELPTDPAQPWRFGISGPRMRRLLAGGWGAAAPDAYTYTFTPSGVGCFAAVTDRNDVDRDLGDFEP